MNVSFSLIGDNAGTPLNEAQTADVSGNLIGSASGGGAINPRLGPLANNGGPTQTHSLLSGSPAIDAGDNGLAVDGNGATLTTDQRGGDSTRIFDDPAATGTGVDIGAFEKQPVQTTGQHIFYNNSSFDNANDAEAIATDKVALRNGETATFENYTSFDRGINGIAVDLFNSNNPTASDFQLKFGNDDDVDTFVILDASSAIIILTTVAGAGVDGSDRVFIEFADGAITNGWLQVTVLANNATGLTNDEVFYFGNAIGESGNDPTNAIVNLADAGGARTNQTGFGITDVLNAFDFNRDARVNLADLAIARTNQSGFTPINLITPTSASGSSSSKLPPAGESIAVTSVSPPVDLSTTKLTTPNFSSFAATTTIQRATTEPASSTERKETGQRNALALVGVNQQTQDTQQDVLDRAFETTGQENDFAENVPLTDIDSLFETLFSVDL